MRPPDRRLTPILMDKNSKSGTGRTKAVLVLQNPAMADISRFLVSRVRQTLAHTDAIAGGRGSPWREPRRTVLAMPMRAYINAMGLWYPPRRDEDARSVPDGRAAVDGDAGSCIKGHPRILSGPVRPLLLRFGHVGDMEQRIPAELRDFPVNLPSPVLLFSPIIGDFHVARQDALNTLADSDPEWLSNFHFSGK